MSDYDQQPPPSSGTLAPPAGPTPHTHGLPATGSNITPVVGLGVALAVVGAAVSTIFRRRDPFVAAERERQREWDRMAKENR